MPTLDQFGPPITKELSARCQVLARHGWAYTASLPPLPCEEWTDEVHDVFAYWEGEEERQNGSRSNTMHALAHHPALAMATLGLGKYFMLNSELSARQIKLTILRVAHRYGSTYQWTHDSHGALQIGISEAEIQAVKMGPSDPIWSTDDAALLSAVDATCNGGQMDDATWSDLIGRFGKRFAMDLIHAAGCFTMIAWGLLAAEVEVEPDFDQFSRNRAK